MGTLEKDRHSIKVQNKLTHLYNIIIEQQPEIMTFHNGNVVTPVWTTGKKKKHVISHNRVNFGLYN